jgi:AcrR family transcriptional regulator
VESTAPAPAPAPAAPRFRVAEATILDAATATFAADGFERAKMEAIAGRAGTTKPTLYARFGSKEGLYAAAVQREYELRKVRLFEVYGTGEELPFRQRLNRWTQAYFDLVRERPDGFALISEGERHPVAAAIIQRAAGEIVDRIADLVARISRRDAPHGARLVAAMITGMLTSCAREASASGVDLHDAAALCESFLHSALRGLDPNLIDAVG